MLRCENCGGWFERPLILWESYGLPGPWRQRFEACPHCRTTGMIEEVPHEAM